MNQFKKLVLFMVLFSPTCLTAQETNNDKDGILRIINLYLTEIMQ